jgi:(2Fe-2S) ferredoxin
MTDFEHTPPMEFDFEGQLLNLIYHDGRLKYARLKLLSEEVQVKLSKTVRFTLGGELRPGCQVRVTGVGKFDRHTQSLKLKATQLLLVEPDLSSPAAPPKCKPKIKVLVCQKSGCLKRGGKGLCATLDRALCDRHLQQHVTVERTGCLKRCSAAPNLVIMPGNDRHTKVSPKTLPKVTDAIARLVDCP